VKKKKALPGGEDFCPSAGRGRVAGNIVSPQKKFREESRIPRWRENPAYGPLCHASERGKVNLCHLRRKGVERERDSIRAQVTSCNQTNLKKGRRESI